MLTTLNRFADGKKLEQAAETADRDQFTRGAIVLRELSQILGVFGEPVSKPEANINQLVGGLMELLIDLRAQARKAKNFGMADEIRKRLGELGVTLEDRTGGTEWRVEG
jgi:cysteinyl-tRNA synthetase